MVRRGREQTRTIVSQLESGVGGKIKKDAPIMQWAVNWAARLISNYQVGEDGKTAFERMKCRKCRTPLAQFGERVMYMEAEDGKDERPKVDRVLMDGIWLGIKGRTGENITGTPQGGGQGAYNQKAAERGEVVIGRGACNQRDPQ